jgi:hypothetical protein
MRVRAPIGSCLLGLLGLLAACGGGDDGPELLDAGVDAFVSIDAGPHVCLTPADFGSPALEDQLAGGVGENHAMPDALVFQGALSADPDRVQLELLAGFGVFEAGITAGTYTIADDELQYADCGLCVRLFTEDSQQYFATGGSITITAIDPNITGTFTGLTFQEVLVDTSSFHSTPVPDGCTTAIASGSFDAVVTY